MANRPKATSRRKAPRPSLGERTPPLEWLSAAVGLLLVLGVFAVIGREVVMADGGPPAFKVEAVSVSPTDGGYLMSVNVRNTGGSPAASVVVEGRLAPRGGEPETAEATLDFVADESARTAGLYFTHDPRQGSVELRAKSYVEP